MSRPLVPYSVQMAAALLCHDEAAATRITGVALDDMAGNLFQFMNSYDPNDLPFIVATLKIVTPMFEDIMNEHGKQICEGIVKSTTAIRVDMDMLGEVLGNGEQEKQ